MTVLGESVVLYGLDSNGNPVALKLNADGTLSGLGGGDVATDTIWDAKGDLAAGIGPDAAVRVGVGTDGYVLTADSTQGAGVKWAPGGALDGTNNGTHTTTTTGEETIDTQIVNGVAWPWIDMGLIADGDSFTFRVYSIPLSGGTSRLVAEFTQVDAPLSGKIVPFDPIPNQNTDAASVKITVQKNAGTHRAFPYVLFLIP